MMFGTRTYIGHTNSWKPNIMSLARDICICIGTAAFVVACVLTLSSSSIGGYPNNILPYALAEEINNNNQSSSISILNKKGLDLLSSASYNEAITYFDKSLAINPNNANILDNKGFALLQLGKYNE